MNNFYVVDCETSNDNPATGSLLSIGAIRRRTREEFYMECRLKEGAEVLPKALSVNGFTMESIQDPSKISESELILKFFEWLGEKALIIGMNPYFDYLFMKFAGILAGLNCKKIPIPHRTYDLHTLAVTFAVMNNIQVPDRGFYTDEIYKMLGMPYEPRPHNALTGARMENDAFHQMLYSIVKR